jgi:hypothetical protein
LSLLAAREAAPTAGTWRRRLPPGEITWGAAKLDAIAWARVDDELPADA